MDDHQFQMDSDVASSNFVFIAKNSSGDQISTQRRQDAMKSLISEKLISSIKALWITSSIIVVAVTLATLVMVLSIHKENKRQLQELIKFKDKLTCACANNSSSATIPSPDHDSTIPSSDRDSTIPSSDRDSTIPSSDHDSTIPSSDHDSATIPSSGCDSTSPPPTLISSCHMLPKSSPSGYYSILSFNGSAIEVYCDMKKTCGNKTGGWMRVASLDMRQPSSKCPSGLCLNTSTPRTCRRCGFRDTKTYSLKSSVTYDVGVSYSHVCGKVIGYQVGSTDGYSSAYSNKVDGMSLTNGVPGANIWTFVAANEWNYCYPETVCPCMNPTDRRIKAPPSFIGDYYFCDTAPQRQTNRVSTFYRENPLWDGKGCIRRKECCTFNNPPWFYRNLQKATSEPIQMTISLNTQPDEEDVAIELIEVLVQ